MWASLKRDPFVRFGSILLGLCALSYLYLHFRFPSIPGVEYWFQLGDYWYEADYYLLFDNTWYMLFIALAMAALLRRHSHVRSREKPFWDYLTLGLGFWLAYCTLYLVVATLLETAVGLTGADALFLLFYLAVILAVDARPDLEDHLQARDTSHRIESFGTVLFAFGLLSYFVVIPYFREAEADGWSFVQSYYFHVSLDVYLALRLGYLASAASLLRWRYIYGVLAAGFLAVFIADFLELCSYLPGLELHLPIVTGPFWYLPFFCILLAARLRQLSFPKQELRPWRAWRGRRLVVFAFVLPLLHFALYGGSLLRPESREVRELLVLVYLLFMGALAQAQYRLLDRRHRMAESERESAVEALERTAKDYRGLFENAHDAIIIFRPDDEIILEVNPRACEVYGARRDEFIGRSLTELAQGGSRSEQLIQETLKKGTIHNLETVHRRFDGSEIAVHMNASVVEYKSKLAILTISRDITERKRGEERLLHDALHDALTGLPNRVLFIDRLEVTLLRARRHADYQFAVLFLDLDRFKAINDRFGHAKGDQLLVAMGQRLKACLRPTDTAARLGGDEFTLLLDGIRDPSDATRVAERIQQELSAPFRLGGDEITTTASIGIALGSTGYEHPDEVLRHADIAMYRAKELGGTPYAIFDPVMHERAVARLKLETNLRRVVEREELRLHYQPIVDLKNDRIAGVEALIRWLHPDSGLVLPADFLPVAEETGMSVPIGRWVLGEACRQAKDWQPALPDERPLAVCVNLSPSDLQQRDLLDLIASALRSSGLAADRLHLEITENTLMQSPETTIQTLQLLNDLGVVILIDDFGSGHSSLSYLHRLPVHGLKIDRSFAGGLTEDRSKREIVNTLVRLGHHLGLEVTAEGIETDEQVRHLRELGCDYAQGYVFSRPLASDDVNPFLLAHNSGVLGS